MRDEEIYEGLVNVMVRMDLVNYRYTCWLMLSIQEAYGGISSRIASHDMDYGGISSRIASHDMDYGGISSRIASHDMDYEGER